jgi:hypothetical protein
LVVETVKRQIAWVVADESRDHEELVKFYVPRTDLVDVAASRDKISTISVVAGKDPSMNRENWSRIFVASVLCLLANSAGAANLVVNGDFEGTTAVDAGTGDVLPTGWTNGRPSPASLSKVNVDTAVNAAIDLGPQSGTHYVRYQSPATNGTADCLLQDLTTVPDQKYTVSFWIAATSTSVGNPSGINPVWDENRGNQASMPVGQLFAPATNTGPVPYQFFSFLETASSSVTRLDFHATDVNGSILLDNVAMTPVAIPGDYNLDGQVGPDDYMVWKSTFGSTSQLASDGNGDNVVDAADYTVWRDHLTTGSGAAAAVPEPRAIVLLGIAGAVVGLSRRRKRGSGVRFAIDDEGSRR